MAWPRRELEQGEGSGCPHASTPPVAHCIFKVRKHTGVIHLTPYTAGRQAALPLNYRQQDSPPGSACSQSGRAWVRTIIQVFKRH